MPSRASTDWQRAPPRPMGLPTLEGWAFCIWEFVGIRKKSEVFLINWSCSNSWEVEKVAWFLSGKAVLSIIFSSNFSSASWLPHFRHRPDLCRWFREVPRARPQEVRRWETRLLGQPQVCRYKTQVVLSRSVEWVWFKISDRSPWSMSMASLSPPETPTSECKVIRALLCRVQLTPTPHPHIVTSSS